MIHGVTATQFRWYAQDGKRTFECETEAKCYALVDGTLERWRRFSSSARVNDGRAVIATGEPISYARALVDWAERLQGGTHANTKPETLLLDASSTPRLA